jgi:hypothetical protein
MMGKKDIHGHVIKADKWADDKRKSALRDGYDQSKYTSPMRHREEDPGTEVELHELLWQKNLEWEGGDF